jgi:TetR/AcrR family transcriptional regulator, mexCD-oprJ operon repressor
MAVSFLDASSLPLGEVPQTNRSPLQQRVAGAILEAAAHVFAAGDEDTSMSEVAEVAGVGRATLYRYFPNRQVLVAELDAHAAAEVGARLRDARIDGVAVEEGVRRAVRALIDVGDLIIVLARGRTLSTADDIAAAVGEPLRALMERGQSAGAIRGDVAATWLSDVLVSNVVTALSARPALGTDDTTAIVSSLFLEGAGATGGREAGHLTSPHF